MNHLILTNLVDYRIHNLKSYIKSLTYTIENSIDSGNNINLKEKAEIELNVLEKHRQIIFDNFLLFK